MITNKLRYLILIIFLFFLSIVLFFMLYSIDREITPDDFSDVNLTHWSHMPIDYKITNRGCDQIQINQIRKGLEIIENSTSGKVKFTEQSGADLDIFCINRENVKKEYTQCKNITLVKRPQKINWYDEGYLRSSRDYLISVKSAETFDGFIYELCFIDQKEAGINFGEETLGEGGPTKVKEGMIEKAEAIFYQQGNGKTTCRYPTKEIHEILHSFGFDHSYEPQWDSYYGYSNWTYVEDIMFPYLYCSLQDQLNEKYISCLNYIYSNGQEGKCSDVNFLSSKYVCEEGWFLVEGTEYCCPQKGMKIENGYCV